MESVLHKTMQSLESALRYNPSSVELMASLAEVYVRLGRFDRRTMELCEAVLSRQVDNVLLQQAQSIGLLIEQSRALEESLGRGEAPPPPQAVESAIETLGEFLAQSGECVDTWMAWTRFQILAGRIERAREGVETLLRLGGEGLEPEFHQTLHHVAERGALNAEQYRELAALFTTLGAGGMAIKLYEKLFDEGRAEVGPTLLDVYLQRFSPSRPDEVPETLRDRLFTLLLDHPDREVTAAWLRKATLLGWEIKAYSQNYAQSLMTEGVLDDAFAVLQRMPMDATAKRLLNELSELYEARDDIDKAVAVLRYINDHQLVEDNEYQRQQEKALVRDAELSMAELLLKNGRHSEALQKFVSAFCLSTAADPELLDRIDEILETAPQVELEPLIRLGYYFRRQGDHPKALFYLNQAIDRDPTNKEVTEELEGLFDEILRSNPDLPALRLELGELYLRTGRLELAMQKLKEAAETPLTATRANRGLAEIHLRQGQFNEALNRFHQYSAETQDLESLYRLHEEFMRRQLYREALSALDLVVRANPAYRDVTEKVRLLEDRIGKLQPELVCDPKMKELIGDLAIGRYQYLDKLGSGGMGVVYKVFDIRNQQTVAMKILRDSLSGSSKALDRFFREARIAATIRHRNIVNIYDYNISNLSGQSYIVMEFVDGPPLRDVIDRQFQDTINIPLNYITEILYYMVQLCDALEAAHSKGIVHRDIKPDNIMLNSQGEVKITDFGIVHVEEATFTPTGAMLGTPRYMSPEQVTGGKIDGRSDIYSVGILLYEALVGSPPFITGDIAYQQIHNPPIPPREINPIIPQGVEAMILKCLSKKPDDRFLSAYNLKGEVGRQLDNLGGCTKYGGQTCADVMPDDPLGGGLGLGLGLEPAAPAGERLGSETELDM